MATTLRGVDNLDSKTIQEPPVFRATRITDFDYTSSTWVAIPFDRVDIDTDSGWDATNSRWVAPVSGWYQVSAQATIGTGTVRGGVLEVRKTGEVAGNVSLYTSNWDDDATDDIGLTCAGLVHLDVSQYIETWVYMYEPSASTERVFANKAHLSTHLVRAD